MRRSTLKEEPAVNADSPVTSRAVLAPPENQPVIRPKEFQLPREPIVTLLLKPPWDGMLAVLLRLPPRHPEPGRT